MNLYVYYPLNLNKNNFNNKYIIGIIISKNIFIVIKEIEINEIKKNELINRVDEINKNDEIKKYCKYDLKISIIGEIKEQKIYIDEKFKYFLLYS